MKACVLHKKGDIRYEDIPAPEIKDPHEVKVKMLAAGICGSDQHYYTEGGIGTAIVVREPIVIGHEGCGVVEEVGSAVTGIKAGDPGGDDRTSRRNPAFGLLSGAGDRAGDPAFRQSRRIRKAGRTPEDSGARQLQQLRSAADRLSVFDRADRHDRHPGREHRAAECRLGALPRHPEQHPAGQLQP